MLFIILADNFPNALKFFFCIFLMQIEHFSLMEQIHTNQCANNCDIGKLSSKVRDLCPRAFPDAVLRHILPVDGSRELGTK